MAHHVAEKVSSLLLHRRSICSRCSHTGHSSLDHRACLHSSHNGNLVPRTLLTYPPPWWRCWPAASPDPAGGLSAPCRHLAAASRRCAAGTAAQAQPPGRTGLCKEAEACRMPVFCARRPCCGPRPGVVSVLAQAHPAGGAAMRCSQGAAVKPLLWNPLHRGGPTCTPTPLSNILRWCLGRLACSRRAGSAGRAVPRRLDSACCWGGIGAASAIPRADTRPRTTQLQPRVPQLRPVYYPAAFGLPLPYIRHRPQHLPSTPPRSRSWRGWRSRSWWRLGSARGELSTRPQWEAEHPAWGAEHPAGGAEHPTGELSTTRRVEHPTGELSTTRRAEHPTWELSTIRGS